MAITSPYLRVDESAFPLVEMHVSGEALSEAHAPELLAAIRALLSKQRRFAVIVVLESPKIPDAKARRILGDGVDELGFELSRWLVAVADVPSSDLLRHAITAIRWIAPPTYPARAFATVSEAREWASSMLANERGAS